MASQITAQEAVKNLTKSPANNVRIPGVFPIPNPDDQPGSASASYADALAAGLSSPTPQPSSSHPQISPQQSSTEEAPPAALAFNIIYLRKREPGTDTKLSES